MGVSSGGRFPIGVDSVQARSTRDGELPVILVKPSSGWRAVNVRELWAFRDLIRSLALRDVKLRYRQTALGVVWVVIQPLLAAGIFSFVFGTVANLPTDGVPYIVFAYAGLLAWNLFNSTVSKASNSLVQHASMVQKVYFPRLALPCSVVPGSLIDFVVALGLMAVLTALNDTFSGLRVLTLPIWVVLVLFMAIGVGLVASALMVSYRDVAQVLPVAMQMLLYISPVAYSLDAVPANLRTIYALNPLVGVLEGFRWALVGGTTLNVGYAVYSAVVACVLLVLGALFFRRMERKFADVV
jgi:lipopolysaccharide transport system permease protein